MEKSYLFLLRKESYEELQKAYDAVQNLGIRVPAQYGCAAMEILATSEAVEKIFDLGFFRAYSGRAFTKELSDRLSEAQQVIVKIWNQRFSSEFKKLKLNAPSRNVRWGSQGFKEPAPYTMYDVSNFRKKLKQFAKTAKPGRKLKDFLKINMQKFKTSDIAVLESDFTKLLKDNELGYHATRLWSYLTPAERKQVAELESAQFIEAFALPEDPEEPSNAWTMHGKISVGVVIVESSLPGGPRFTGFERGSILNGIFTGLNFLTSQHPSGYLSWMYDFQFVDISVDNKDNGSVSNFDNDHYWAFPGILAVNFNGTTFQNPDPNFSLVLYRRALREAHKSKHSILLFITPYGTSDFAYSVSKFTVLAPHNNNFGGHGIGGIGMAVAHETCHHFGAPDEYSDQRTQGSVCVSCDGNFGADHVPNGNCEACASPGQACLMRGHQPYICEYTRGHIGWSDLFVDLFTADVSYAGTDDKVWLDIGDKKFVLDSVRIDDRERGGRQGYALWAGRSLQRGEIKRILIRKSEDGNNGGWKLDKIRVRYRNELVSYLDPKVWLADDHLWWLGNVYDHNIVNTLKIIITTADEQSAGTDDIVSLEMAGRRWTLNSTADDFERGATNTFNLDPQTGLYPNQISTITIKKARDGESGRWKLKGVKLLVNGNEVYNNQNINTWISGNNLTWTADL